MLGQECSYSGSGICCGQLQGCGSTSAVQQLAVRIMLQCVAEHLVCHHRLTRTYPMLKSITNILMIKESMLQSNC
jgi:hypothetical protein